MSMSEPGSSYVVVLVTVSSEMEGKAIAQALVQSHLAACVNLFPIRSIYTWQDQIHDDEEWQLLIKTDLRQFSALEAKIKAIHSYDVPEIIALPILAGSLPYLRWITEQVNPQ